MALNGITAEMLDIAYDICPCIGSASVKEKGNYEQIAIRLRNPFPPRTGNMTIARRHYRVSEDWHALR